MDLTLRFKAGIAPYQPHPLHGPTAVWTETNCAIDAWVELVHRLGFAPEPAGACALSADVCGDQWVMIKYPVEDLRLLYGLDVVEFNPWKPTLEHVCDHLRMGNLMTVEVDSWWLPDTTGTAYHRDHVKTGIIPVRVDPQRRRLAYLHNAGLFDLEGPDFEGAFATEPGLSLVPFPYIELIRAVESVGPDELRRRARGLVGTHLSRRPRDNPVTRLRPLIEDAVTMLPDRSAEFFHAFAFATLRQFGATAQLAAGCLRWIEPDDDELAAAADGFEAVAVAAKSMQFVLARASRGRRVTLGAALDAVSDTWHDAMERVVSWDGRA